MISRSDDHTRWIEFQAVAAILDRYPLSSGRVIGRTSAGRVNENWLIEDGVEGRRYFLRGFPRTSSLDRIGFVLRFQEYLGAQGLPVPGVIEGLDQEKWTLFDGRIWALFEWLEGEAYDFADIRQTRAAGEVIARFHRVGMGFKADDALSNPFRRKTFEHFRTAAEQPGLLTHLFPDKRFADDLDFSRAWWSRLAENWPVTRIESLPRALLHGDLHGGNMAFVADRATAMFDFDDIAHGPRVCDVGQGFFNFGRKTRGIETEEARKLRGEYARTFLGAYLSVVHLTNEELDALPTMAGIVFPPDAYGLRRMKEQGLDFETRFRRDVAITREVDSELRRIAPELGWSLPSVSWEA